jgi:hypothetical protein
MKRYSFCIALFFAGFAQAVTPVGQSPWGRVPALPTACYSNQDDFAAKIAAAQEAVTRDIDQQERVNSDLKQSAKDADVGDDATRAARMQELLAKDPQAAIKMMQQSQSAAATAQTAAPEDTANQQKLDRELKDLLTQYHAALDKAGAPVEKRILDRFAPGGRNWQGFLSPGASEADRADWASLIEQWNTEREKACTASWQASGPFHAWFKRYRDYLVQDHIPWVEQNEQGASGFLALMADSSSGSYKSTATLKAVSDYMKRAAEVFNNRPSKPRSDLLRDQ